MGAPTLWLVLKTHQLIKLKTHAYSCCATYLCVCARTCRCRACHAAQRATHHLSQRVLIEAVPQERQARCRGPLLLLLLRGRDMGMTWQWRPPRTRGGAARGCGRRHVHTQRARPRRAPPPERGQWGPVHAAQAVRLCVAGNARCGRQAVQVTQAVRHEVSAAVHLEDLRDGRRVDGQRVE